MICSRVFGLGVVAAAAMGVASAADAAVIAYWDYNDSNLTVDQGAGTMTIGARSPAYGGGSTLNAQAGIPAGNAFGIGGGGGPFMIDFAIDTRGFTSLSFSFALRADPSWIDSRPGGVQVTYLYSADGGATFSPLLQFTPLADYIQYGFNLPAVLADNENAVFRIFQNPGGVDPSDLFLIDNVTFSGVGAPPPPSAVAEPATVASFGLGLIALGWLRRRAGGGHR